MFIARRSETPPARFGGAELNFESTSLVSFRPSEQRRRLSGLRAINVTPKRGEYAYGVKKGGFI